MPDELAAMTKPLTPIELAELQNACWEGLTPAGRTLLRRALFQLQQAADERRARTPAPPPMADATKWATDFMARVRETIREHFDREKVVLIGSAPDVDFRPLIAELANVLAAQARVPDAATVCSAECVARNFREHPDTDEAIVSRFVLRLAAGRVAPNPETET